MIRILIVLLACVPALVLAQQDSDSTTDTGKSFIRVSSLGAWEGKPLFLRLRKAADDKAKVYKIDVLDMGYSAPIPHKRGQAVEFVQETDDPENPYQLVLNAKVPASVKSPLVLLIPSKDKMLYKVFDLDPANFPYGSYQMVNFTTHRLRVAIDKEVKALAPSKQHVFRDASGKIEAIWIRAGIEPDGKIVFTSMAMKRPGKRMIVFFLDNDDGDPVTTRMLVDFRPEEKQ